MSSVLYGRGSYRQGDALRSRSATVQRDINDLADDHADLREEVRALVAAVAEMNKALAATVARLDALTAAEAPTTTNVTAAEAPTTTNVTAVALRAPTSQ